MYYCNGDPTMIICCNYFIVLLLLPIVLKIYFIIINISSIILLFKIITEYYYLLWWWLLWCCVVVLFLKKTVGCVDTHACQVKLRQRYGQPLNQSNHEVHVKICTYVRNRRVPMQFAMAICRRRISLWTGLREMVGKACRRRQVRLLSKL